MVSGRVIRQWAGDDLSENSAKEMNEAARQSFLTLVDPFRLRICLVCGGTKEEGTVSCGDCSLECPDPDCGGTREKLYDQDMCDDCRDWLDDKDVRGFIVERGRGGRRDRWVRLDGRREGGYFVYQLADQERYIGHTYNPTKRQFEHDERLARELESDRVNVYMAEHDIDDERLYYNASMHRYEQDITTYEEYLENWENNNRRILGRIAWLSPVLDSRTEAFRCEWALKGLRKLFTSQYEEVVHQSSIPMFLCGNYGLEFDPEDNLISFPFELSVSFGLHLEQIARPKLFELEQFDESDEEFKHISNTEFPENPSFRGQISDRLVGRWRSRVVNDYNVNCRWSDFEINKVDVTRTLQDCIGIENVQTFAESRKQINIRWQVNNRIDGVRFDIERSNDRGDRVLLEVGNSTEWLDDDFIAKANEITTLSYRIRAKLGNLTCDWIPTDRKKCQVTIDKTVLEVGDRVRDALWGEGVVENLTKGRRADVRFDMGFAYRRPLSELRMM